MYTINLSNMSPSEETYRNLTWDLVNQDDELLLAEAVDRGYTIEGFDVEEKADYVRQSDGFYEMEDSFTPMYNYAHVLSERPSEEEVLRIYKGAPNVQILYIEELETNVIALNGCGMDFSDSLAYAYMVIDRHIPHGFSTIDKAYTITEEALKELQEALK